MKIIYNPHFTGNVYFSHNLWDEVTAGDAALLEQLLLRASLPQTVVDDSEAAENARAEAYAAAIRAQGDTIFSASLLSDWEGTAKQLLKWRDALVMAGWTAEMTCNSQNSKLRIFAQCDGALKACPSRADRWREVYQYLKEGHKILNDTDSIEVRVPKGLISPLIAKALAFLPNVTYLMEDLNASLDPEGHSSTVIMPHEQYEAWQLLRQLPYDTQTMLVCGDEKRLNDTMRAIGGDQWQTDHVGCPHCAATLYDTVDTPQRLLWLDCAGDRVGTDPYEFLSAKDRDELSPNGVSIPDAELRSATVMRWMYTLLNGIHEWILVAPGCHMGEPLGEHPMLTALRQHTEFYKRACEQGKNYTLPMKNEGDIITLEPVSDIAIDPALLTRIPQPSDSYSTIDKLVVKPLDYVLENLGGLTAPEDDKEPIENLMKGKIAHKVVELLVNIKDEKKARPMKEIRRLFDNEYLHYFDLAMADKDLKKEADFLTQDDNKNMLALFKDELRQSIGKLLDIIDSNRLTPLCCEYETKAPFGPFGNHHGYVDMLLEDAGHNLVVIDLKWSDRDEYQNRIKDGEAYQLYMYKHAVEKQLAPKTVVWYAYYIFPKMELFTEPTGVATKWSEWLDERTARLAQLAQGTVAQADPEQDKYPKHLILKNLNIK